MKEYIKPEIELIEYSINEVISASREPETPLPDIDAGGDGDFFS